MTPIVYDFVADVANHSRYFIVPVPMGNVGTRIIDVLLVENGKPYEYASGASYVCTGVNGGGHGLSITCSLTNGKIRIPMSNAMLSYKGIGVYRVEEIVSGTIISTFNFHVSVEEVPVAPEEIVTSDDFQELADLISTVQNHTRWIIGEGLPTASQGSNSDMYLDTLTNGAYQKDNGGWNYKCTLGSNLYIAYANTAQGAGFSPTYTNQKYLGLCKSQSLTQPTDPSLYTSMAIISPNTMLRTDYGGTDNNTVGQADRIKGEFVISNIVIPANTTTATTTVVVESESIGTSSILEGVYCTTYGLNPINAVLADGSLTLTFPATPSGATAMVKIWNMNNYLYPTPTDWTDYVAPEAEDVDIDFSNFSV